MSQTRKRRATTQTVTRQTMRVVNQTPEPMAKPSLLGHIRAQATPDVIALKVVKTVARIGVALVAIVAAMIGAFGVIPMTAAFVGKVTGINYGSAFDAMLAMWLLPLLFITALLVYGYIKGMAWVWKTNLRVEDFFADNLESMRVIWNARRELRKQRRTVVDEPADEAAAS